MAQHRFAAAVKVDGMSALRDSEQARGRTGRARIDAILPRSLQWNHGSTSAPGAGTPEKGGGIMCRVMRSLLATALLAVLGATGAWALTPDDAIRLTESGVDDVTIIAKICSDAEAWDLSADDIVYLRNLGVSDGVVQALIDPAAAADKYGFTLGVATQESVGQPVESDGSSAYVYSLGYYYGPLSRYYYCDPYFYPYIYSGGFSFGFSYWPWFYASYSWPYSYGYYPYPYFWYPCDSYYYGYGYCGNDYDHFHGPPPPGAGNYYGDTRWRDGANHGPPAYGSEKPNYPEIRSRGGSGAPGGLAAKDPSGYSQAGGERASRVGLGTKDGGSVSRGRLSTRDPVSTPARTVGRRDQASSGNEWRSDRGTRVIYGGKPSQRSQLQARDPSRSFLQRGNGNGAGNLGLENPGRSSNRSAVRSRDPGRTFVRREGGRQGDGQRVVSSPVRGTQGRGTGQVLRSENGKASAPSRESGRQALGGIFRGSGGSPVQTSPPAAARGGSGGGRGGGAPQGGGGARGHR
jgi:hypothetical protein